MLGLFHTLLISIGDGRLVEGGTETQVVKLFHTLLICSCDGRLVEGGADSGC